MSAYLVSRVIAVVPTILLLLFFVVIIIRLIPGDPVDTIVGDTHATDEQRAALRHELGLDQNVGSAYATYALNVVQGDLSKSLFSQMSVTSLIVDRIGITLELTCLALLIGVLFGVPIGIISAVTPNSPIDLLLRSFSILWLTVPSFVLATLVVVLPTVWWQWSPPVTYQPVDRGVLEHLSQFIAPATVLGLGLSATLMRLTRTLLLEVLRMDYIRTARSKGLSDVAVILRHALRNALIPVLTLTGVQIASLLSGAVLIESVFGLPGIGNALITAIRQRDYPVVQGLTVATGLFVMFINLMVDSSYGYLDPRVRR